MWYCKSLIKTAIRQPSLWLATCVFAALLLIPVFTNLDTYSINFARNGVVSDEYDYLVKQAESYGSDQRSSENFKTLEKQIELLGNIKLATTSEKFYQASLTYYSFVSSNSLAFRLYDTDFYYLAQEAFSQQMQHVTLSNQYETESKLPAIHSISYSINRLPVVLRFLPAIGTFIALAQITSREKLLGKDQIPYLKRLSGCIGASTIIASSICLCSYIPLLTIELMHNGIGLASYPVVLVQAGTIYTSDALQCAVWSVIYTAVTNMFVSLVLICAFSITRKFLIPLVIYLLVICSSIFAMGHSSYHLLLGWIEYLPIGYLDIGAIVGFVGDVQFFTNKIDYAQPQPLYGLLIFILWAVLIIFITIGINKLRKLLQADLVGEIKNA